MSLPLNPAPLFSENEYDTNELKRKRDRERIREPMVSNNSTSRNKTIKNNQRHNTIESMIQSLHNSTDDSGNDNLSDFNPLPSPPQSAGVQRAIDKSKEQVQSNQSNQSNQENQVNYNSQLKLYTNMLNQNKNPINSNNIEAFSKQNTGSNASEYYKQYQIPTYYNQMSENIGGNKELLDKLNYMIHLLEEQKDEKTGHVTEEIILYTFLGVFMIFIIDSFARVGKYVR